MSKNRWNPHGWPSPTELGFKKGDRVRGYADTVVLEGVIKRTYKHCFVIEFDDGMTMQCHPKIRDFHVINAHG